MKLTRKNLRVVVVDDDENDTDLLRRALIKAGFIHPFTHFTDGEVAFGYFQYTKATGSTAPHIILLDINMPVINGVDALHRLAGHHPDR